ncbi:MAG TPA: polysaccharide lyase family 8 super-sandwich domain-containing protein [Pelobium sp.]|nr:polysaccharide lyase family 8 super-sandwich domain-containing protein [Pelobium sp.]
MKKLLFVVFLLSETVSVSAQQRFVDFNSAIPANWTASNSSQISLSNSHLKGGAKALKWTPQSSSILTASSLNIPSSETFNYQSSSAQFFIYSTAVSTDTLIFKFYDASNVLKREGRMLLNYQGWREYHRSYRYDYNNGNESSAFLLNKMEIVYKPSTSTNHTIYFDEMTFVGNTDARNPGPHMALDMQHFALTSAYTKSYFSFNHQADIPLLTASSAEISAIQTLKNTYKRNLATVSSTDLTNAKNFVNNCAIVRNTDGSIKGRGIATIYNVDTLTQLSAYCSALARAYGKNNDADALNKLNLFVEYLLDQGLAEGARVTMPYNDYTASRTFPVGFLEALPYLSSITVKAEVLKMLKWSNEFNTIYNSNPTPGLETDFLHVKSNFLLELALLGDTDEEIARDLKSFSRYLEQFTYIGEGARDGIKIDGTAFHHNSQHISYMYAFGTWISRAFELKGTPFKISSLAYQNMGFAIKTLFLETSKGAIYPHSASGRGPFPSAVPVSSTDFDKLIQVGGDLIGQNIEPELAKFYNYIFNTNRYAVASINLDGYYQLNYGQTGIMHKNNWTAVSRGFTDKMFGAEIYAGANRYGRYQSYGALEVLYDGSLTATGYINGGAGWDWNMMPGTTSVNQSYQDLKPLISGTASEYQSSAFAGALADGNNGVFGMDFVQNAGNKYATSNLKFRKSVFTFDSIMVCLGSNISASNTSDPVITTLFQAVNTSTNPSIYINSLTATSGAYNQSISTATNGVWLVNGQTTGFYIPKGNSTLQVFRGTQTTPLQSTDNITTTATANASKAWITHGTNPSEANYQFVVVPGIMPQRMSALALKIDNQEVYQVLKQTDAVHAVKFIPQNVIAYSCFLPQPAINTGLVKGISGNALLTVKESGDSLIVKIANPDLNTVDDTESKWRSSVSNTTLSLIGNWNVAENFANAGITSQDNLLEANFALKDGLAQTLVLVKNDSLPITLTSFTATNSTEFIALKWQTKSESNTAYFNIYRSLDGEDFEEITHLKAAGISSEALNYEVKDADYPKGAPIIYYKLETTDLNGKVSYSKVIAVDVALQDNTSKLYPNPVKDKITLAYYSPKPQTVRFQLINAEGKLVHIQNQLVQPGINQIGFETSMLANGMYLIKWENNTEKFIKLN